MGTQACVLVRSSTFHEIPLLMSFTSIETAIAIAFFGTIAIGIAIARAIFQLLLLLLILLREFFNYPPIKWTLIVPLMWRLLQVMKKTHEKLWQGWEPPDLI